MELDTDQKGLEKILNMDQKQWLAWYWLVGCIGGCMAVVSVRLVSVGWLAACLDVLVVGLVWIGGCLVGWLVGWLAGWLVEVVVGLTGL